MTNAVHPWETRLLGKAPFRVVGFEVRTYQSCADAPVQPGATCDACGTAIKNVYMIRSSDGRDFVVGCDCVAKTGDRVLIADVKAAQAERRAVAREARRAALADGRKAERAAKGAAFFAAHPEFAAACEECTHEIAADIAARVRMFGSVSEAQMALVIKLHAEQVGGTFTPAEPPLVPAPVTDKRVTLTGRVLATKVVDSMYGSTLKMMLAVRTPDGMWKAWSTVPSGMHRPQGDGEWRGMVATVKARVEVSKDDPSFAFLKRPTFVG
jgi:hypothetical protein